MTIKTIDGKHYIDIPFRLKDSLKKAIPSAKWDRFRKQWYVGPRSKKKLEAWLASAESEAAKIESERKAKKEALGKKLETMVKLDGKTYHIKDALKERFDALFHDGAWYVPKEKFEEAQEFVDQYNSGAVMRADVEATEGDLQKLLELIDKVSKNFSEDGTEYLQDDDFSEMLRGYHYEAEDALKILSAIAEDLFFASQDGEENKNYYQFGYKNSEGILRFFNLPETYCFKIVGMKGGHASYKVQDYALVEQDVINELVREKRYGTVDIEEASKKVEGVGGHEPTFYFKSKVTGNTFPASAEISERRGSSRVVYYDAKNVRVLLSDNFETRMNYWRNRERNRVISLS